MARGHPDVLVGGTADPLPRRLVARIVGQVLRRERRTARIAVTFLGKRQMRALNARYLRHDRVTDVVSFALHDPDGAIAGDVYVCRYAAARSARLRRGRVRDELARLVVHGTLHVLGWDHPAGPARTRSAMWRNQERHLASMAWLS